MSDLAKGLFVQLDKIGAADAGLLRIEGEVDVGLGVDLGLVGAGSEIVDPEFAFSLGLELPGHGGDGLVLDLLPQLSDLFALRRCDRVAEHAVDHREVTGEAVDLDHVLLGQRSLAGLEKVGDRLLPGGDFALGELDVGVLGGVGGRCRALLVEGVGGLEAKAHPAAGRFVFLFLFVIFFDSDKARRVVGRRSGSRDDCSQRRGCRCKQEQDQEK